MCYDDALYKFTFYKLNLHFTFLLTYLLGMWSEISTRLVTGFIHHQLFAHNTITVDNGYVNEQDRKAHCALTSAHNITSTVERNTHSTIHGTGVTRNR